ncbi:MAG: hypothetical protein VYD57_04405 [Pseudomonadota bacterium]|nr:hypothetical protein [Pseudomonadota bacterium]
MTIQKASALTTVALGVGLLGGCASVESCDPNQVGFVLASAACNSGGHFAQRARNLDQNRNRIGQAVERERIAVAQAESRIRNAVAQQRISQAQARAIRGQVASLNRDINRLRSTQSGPQTAAVRRDIARKKQAINEFATIAVF